MIRSRHALTLSLLVSVCLSLLSVSDAAEPLAVSPQSAATSTCNDGWYDGPPVNGVSSATAIAVDGAGNVYVGGAEVAGSSIVNGIAKWDGANWSALGSGIDGTVSGVAVSGTDVYIVGSFTTAGGVAANHIAKWDGSNWSAVGSGLPGQVNDIEISGGAIYVGGGGFDGNGVTGFVSLWNGSTWTELGSGLDWLVSDIAVSGSNVYAAGDATRYDPDPNRIAKWDGSSWSSLGAGPNGIVHAIAVSGTDVYAAGYRVVAQGNSDGFVTKWNGSVWSELGTGVPDNSQRGGINNIAVSGTDVYVGGWRDFANQVGSWIGKWDGESWSALGDWTASVTAIAISGTSVYFGSERVYESGYARIVSGTFSSSAGNVRRADGIAKWNGSSWSDLGDGIYSSPTAFARSGTDVYAVGYFTTDGGTTYSPAAIWNGTGWTRLGSWPSDPPSTSREVSAVAVSGTDVYVGGRVYAGGISTGYVAKWNGSSWATLGSGMAGGAGRVSSLEIYGNDVYAGGDFTTAGGVTANNIAKWNGSSWSAVGSGLSSLDTANLAVFGTDLYAGWYQLAKWNGTSWTNPPGPPHFESRLQSPQDFCCWIHDMDVIGSDLYFADGYESGYGNGRGFVSKWNGATWTQLGDMCCTPVYDIAVAGTNIYAGGDFYLANGTPVNRIARWNGSTWSALSSSVNIAPFALEVSGTDLFVGGNFTTAGCHVSAGFARYLINFGAEVSVSGRVLTAAGAPIRNAIVTITDPLGETRSTTTSTFGNYSFDNVLAGQTYTFRASSKRSRFQPKSQLITDNTVDLDLVANPTE